MAISNQQTSVNIDKCIDSSSMMGLDTWQAAIFKVNFFIFVLKKRCLFYN